MGILWSLSLKKISINREHHFTSMGKGKEEINSLVLIFDSNYVAVSEKG